MPRALSVLAIVSIALLACGGTVDSQSSRAQMLEACAAHDDGVTFDCPSVSPDCLGIDLDRRPKEPRNVVCRFRCDENRECAAGYDCRLYYTEVPEDMEYVCFRNAETVLR
ncbi:hypothetical protein AKJ09_03532 [Labilithrix luteola]|uniref:Lipoprotein n=1 Tax=Labilithrix luteola TaxID=1391654 RepID=A0A0K1PTK5_9BACT|nr:hypothetical protein [Labilithrix luteola]AKU96868.1 hypothetical protein AKJ09_03532 [Labilithrix luteola]